jgi:hypothetical protein
MKCKNLIIITGMSCQGKTHIAVELREKCGAYIIHTDQFYYPLDKKPPTTLVGNESKEKSEFITAQIPYLKETTIIEGSHIGNKKELDIFIRELGYDGKVYCFKIENPRLKEYFATKYKENTEQLFEGIQKRFDSIYDLEECYTVSSATEIFNILKDKDVYISG